MKIRINHDIDVHVDSKDLIQELIKVTQEKCWCSFNEDKALYNELLKLIQKRKKEPMDLSCIE